MLARLGGERRSREAHTRRRAAARPKCTDELARPARDSTRRVIAEPVPQLAASYLVRRERADTFNAAGTTARRTQHPTCGCSVPGRGRPTTSCRRLGARGGRPCLTRTPRPPASECRLDAAADIFRKILAGPTGPGDLDDFLRGFDNLTAGGFDQLNPGGSRRASTPTRTTSSAASRSSS